MTDLRKAADMALYALENNLQLIEDYGSKEQLNIHHKAIMALYKTLAQPEQEPVECGYDETVGLCTNNPCCEQAQPEQAVVPFPSFMRKRIEQAMDLAINPKGMSVHDGKTTVLVSDLHRMLLIIDSALAQPEHRFDTPESHIVKWSIPVDPNNFGEALAQPEQESKPIYVMGNYAGEGKVVNASFGLPKGAFEFAPYTGKGEASKIKHSLEPEHSLDKKSDNARELGLDYEPDAVQPKE
jgi:hypothetical protein